MFIVHLLLPWIVNVTSTWSITGPAHQKGRTLEKDDVPGLGRLHVQGHVQDPKAENLDPTGRGLICGLTKKIYAYKNE